MELLKKLDSFKPESYEPVDVILEEDEDSTGRQSSVKKRRRSEVIVEKEKEEIQIKDEQLPKKESQKSYKPKLDTPKSSLSQHSVKSETLTNKQVPPKS